MKKITRLDNFKEFAIWLFVMLMGFALLTMLPEADQAKIFLNYVPMHSSMEVIAIAISAMVFGVAWATQKYQPNGRILTLGLGFLGVGLLDWSHTLSFVGMPDYFTPNSVEKTINFWFAARLCAGLTFLLVAFWPYRLAEIIGYRSRYLALSFIAVSVAIVHYVLLYFQFLIPSTYIEEVGLTNFKINFEYVLILLYLLAGLGFLKHSKSQLRSSYTLLALASFTMAMSEIFFTLYAKVTDSYNMAGHIYKIFAYGFLYRALFLETIKQPFEALKKSEMYYAATINALPDLLFEVDRKGIYRAVHASKVEKLAVPLDRIIGKNLNQMLPQEAATICFEAISEADRLGSSHGYRIELDVPEGHRYFELSVAKKFDQEEDAPIFIVLSRDITSTVVNEQKILFEVKLNSMLLETQQRAENENQKEFLDFFSKQIKELLGSSIVFAYEVNETQSSLNLLMSTDYIQGDTDCFIAKLNCISSELGSWADSFQYKRTVLIDSKSIAEGTKGLINKKIQLERLLCLPVIEDNQVKLVIGVANKNKDYTDNEINALQLFGATFWSMIKQRRKTAVINQLSEALEQSPHSVVITNTDGAIHYVNKAFCDVSGYSAEEVIGKNPRILQSGETPRKLYEELWQRITHGRSWQGEFINRNKSGLKYVEAVSVYPIKDQFGELTHFVAHKVDVTEHKAAELRIRNLSDFDSLTGLLNKKTFYLSLTKAIEEAGERNELLSLLWFNLDNFKVINETFGHDIGDGLLVVIANRLIENIGERFTIARHSGDTFVAIIPRETESIVAVLALEILNKLKLPMQVSSQTLSIGASVGIAVFPDDAKTATTLASFAEIAMYRAKEDGRNSLRFFASEMQQNTQRSLDLAVSLNGAQERGELYVVYQPQFDAASGKVVGAEALLRWNHPKWGPVLPSEFIPLAEQTGLIIPIGFWVLEQVVHQVKEWERLGFSNLLIAVNVSAIQFVRIGFVPDLIRLLSKASVSSNRIEIEITEAVALKNSEQAVSIIQQLRVAGFQIALDDFGTGYSSLSYLRRYSINKLKIDQSFVSQLESNESDQSIVNAIIKMAHELNMKTIAEGVETENQARLLTKLGCDQLQGYWMSRPVSTSDFEVLLREQ